MDEDELHRSVKHLSNTEEIQIDSHQGCITVTFKNTINKDNKIKCYACKLKKTLGHKLYLLLHLL